MRATKAKTVKAVKAINTRFDSEIAHLIDWTSVASGYAIAVDAVDAIDVSMDEQIIAAMDDLDVWVEAINSASLRVYPKGV